ncbi:transposase [Segnochrobactrum spirostomi]|uniref:Transposase n=1 Tax=Segnochrobactrum spirostomi TaxID=2608987 RepID=A0A6A7YBB9_9HYPH|nr:transposase [Segnochrobactrum spirostomi]MQT15278.1 transposase [Segnochrobactrum spirostomi]
MRGSMPADRTFHVIEAVVDRSDELGATLRRRWPGEFKERAAAASLVPGTNVSPVARQMGISPSQLFGWRRQALAKGTEIATTAGHSSPEAVPPRPAPIVEIAIGIVVVRVSADIGETDLRRVP